MYRWSVAISSLHPTLLENSSLYLIDHRLPIIASFILFKIAFLNYELFHKQQERTKNNKTPSMYLVSKFYKILFSLCVPQIKTQKLALQIQLEAP